MNGGMMNDETHLLKALTFLGGMSARQSLAEVLVGAGTWFVTPGAGVGGQASECGSQILRVSV